MNDFPFWTRRHDEWDRRVTASAQVAFMMMPMVVTVPGFYRTRGGRQVEVIRIEDKGLMQVQGRHDCGTLDHWHVSGRLFPHMLSDHDLIERIS